MNEAGYIEGRNVLIDVRSADGNYERLPALVAELVSRHPAVIVAVVATPLHSLQRRLRSAYLSFFSAAVIR